MGGGQGAEQAKLLVDPTRLRVGSGWKRKRLTCSLLFFFQMDMKSMGSFYYENFVSVDFLYRWLVGWLGG